MDAIKRKAIMNDLACRLNEVSLVVLMDTRRESPSAFTDAELSVGLAHIMNCCTQAVLQASVDCQIPKEMVVDAIMQVVLKEPRQQPRQQKPGKGQ